MIPHRTDFESYILTFRFSGYLAEMSGLLSIYSLSFKVNSSWRLLVPAQVGCYEALTMSLGTEEPQHFDWSPYNFQVDFHVPLFVQLNNPLFALDLKILLLFASFDG